MAQPPILTLTDVKLTFGGAPLFDGASASIHPGERLCLVGRNGSGKSTLLKIMAGLVQPDSGERFQRPGTHIAYMEQDPSMEGYASLRDFVAEGMDPAEMYRVDMALEGVALDGSIACDAASGGERRRAALARLVADDADLMLIDEPTNHLDILMIGWLEDHLSRHRKAYVLISHDRAFLNTLTRGSLWVDRGVLRRAETGFSGFEAWRDKLWEEEDQARHKLDRLIKAEGRWAVEGISARRKRNQGRVRRLADLRAERSSQIRRSGTAEMAFDGGQKSGKLVAEAVEVSKAFGSRQIVRDFSLKIARGERVAFVGPNGVGKTTVLKMLTGEIAPDAGRIRLGTGLELAVFDQKRAAFAPGATLWDALTMDPAVAVSGASDQVMVRGQPRHVVGYLKDFLFSEAQARGPVSALSGGEVARLLLARIMARNANLLVLDEPTNDLDVETLDLLQELVADYPGTVLLVSHDRDFLDRVATTTIAMEGDGVATVYAGGYSDYRSQRGQKTGSAASLPGTQAATRAKPAEAEKGDREAPRKLSFAQKRRLESLPAEIETLEAEIVKLEGLLADPGLFARDPARFDKASRALTDRQGKLAKAEEDWLELEALNDALS